MLRFTGRATAAALVLVILTGTIGYASGWYSAMVAVPVPVTTYGLTNGDLSLNSLDLNEYKLQGINVTSAVTTKEASYIVSESGGTYYALNGATGETTNDADAATLIQACINALPSTGGKIFLKAGRYDIVTTLVLPSYVTLEGEQTSIINGSEGTWLILANGANTFLITNKLKDTTEISITLRNIVLYGNPANNAAGTGIYFVNSEPSSLFRLDNVVVFGFRDYSVQFIDVNDFWIINCKIVDSYKICLYVESSNDGWIINTDIGGAISASQHGGYFYNCYAMFIRDCVFDNNSGNGLLIEGGGENTISSRFGNNDERGLKLYLTRNNIVSQCDVYNNGVHGISLWDSNSTVVSDNNIFDNRGAGSKTQQKAIIEEGTLSDYNNIHDNIVLGNDDSVPILTYGTHSKTSNNLGFVAANSGTEFISTTLLDHCTSGPYSNLTVGVSVTVGQVLYVKSDGKLWKADATDNTTIPCVAIACGSITFDTAGYVLNQGYFRDDSWNWAAGGILYLSETAGAMTQTSPAGTGKQVQVLGYALTADIIYFDPNLMVLELA